jgi:hypothetical protein
VTPFLSEILEIFGNIIEKAIEKISGDYREGIC